MSCPGRVHERFAFDDVGAATPHLFDDLDDLAHGLVEVLADLAQADVGKLIGVLSAEKRLPLEKHLGALLCGQPGPGRRLDGSFDLAGGATPAPARSPRRCSRSSSIMYFQWSIHATRCQHST